MTAAEFKSVVAIAKDASIDLSDEDDSILDGCALRGFDPVVTSNRRAARFLRWHCQYLNGNWDDQMLTEFKEIFRYKVTLV